MSQLSNRTLKYITSISFSMNPMSPSLATRSMRLLMASLPTKPPTGQNSFPATSLSTTLNEQDQKIQVTYSDKKSVLVKPEGLNVQALVRKIEEPARALRAKEEGL